MLDEREEGGAIRVSLASFRRVFADIAYVIAPPHSSTWFAFDGAVCTCRIWSVQQQGQHILFAGGLVQEGLKLLGVLPRDFGPTPQARRTGRPKGIPT